MSSPLTAPSTEWVIATHNAGKLQEIETLLEDLGIAHRSAAEFQLPVPEETGETFEENAEVKALSALEATGRPTLADDSGVCIQALGGDPGIHTADWAGPNRDFAIARRTVHDRLLELGQGAGARATYVCVLTLAMPDGRVHTRRGETRGILVWPIRGDLGSGFEPMFMPDGYAVTYGEMQPRQRRRINARAQAMRGLVAELSVGT